MGKTHQRRWQCQLRWRAAALELLDAAKAENSEAAASLRVAAAAVACLAVG